MTENPAVWTFAGAVTTAVIGLIGALIKYRGDQRRDTVEIGRLKAETKSILVDTSAKAVETVAAAMAPAQATIEDLTKRVTIQDARYLELSKSVGEIRRKHSEAIAHIAERERWTAERWPGKRPRDLAEIPLALRTEVIEADPDLATVVVIPPVTDGEAAGDEEAAGGEEVPPRARLPP